MMLLVKVLCNYYFEHSGDHCNGQGDGGGRRLFVKYSILILMFPQNDNLFLQEFSHTAQELFTNTGCYSFPYKTHRCISTINYPNPGSEPLNCTTAISTFALNADSSN